MLLRARFILMVVAIVECATALPYTELVPRFNRLRSPVTVRKVDSPTAANLDFAAYDRNPVLRDVTKVKKLRQPRTFTLDTLTFGGVVDGVVGSCDATPLTEREKRQPLACKPLLKRLWRVVKAENIQKRTAQVAGYKWSDSSVYQPYQEVHSIYLHQAEGAVEWWAKVEFAPWVPFKRVVSDEDGDGVSEIYCRLNLGSCNPDSLAKAVAWIKSEYTQRILSTGEMVDWITDLASYWYPTKNTDIIDLDAARDWPDSRTKRSVRRALHGLTVHNPLAVVEGKPWSPKQPIYNVYIVDSIPFMPNPVKGAAVQEQQPERLIDTGIAENFRLNTQRFAGELKPYGSYAAWAAACQPITDCLSHLLTTFPADQMGFAGTDGFVFFRKSVDYLLAGDLGAQEQRYNPLANLVALKKYLAQTGTELLFVAVPNKEEIYYDRMGSLPVLPEGGIIHPYSRKIVADLQKKGVEVVDLLPAFLAAKELDTVQAEPVYQRQDTHWTNRGLTIAAQLIAARIKQYRWFATTADTISYTLHDTTFLRAGDILERLPANRQSSYEPQLLHAQQVRTPEGVVFNGNNPAASILLIGDSFTGVFESVDCKGAGVGAHIAAYCRMPVDIITSWGGGPMVPQKMIRIRGANLKNKRVVVYLMVSRDLYHYSDGWGRLTK